MLRKLKRVAASVAGVAVLALTCTASQAVTPFQTDVGTAINNGLAYLDTSGAYAAAGCKTGCSNNMGYAVGLTTLALLEKRASGNPNDPPQGYAGASTADQSRLRLAVNAILSNTYTYDPFTFGTQYFYAYFNGSALSALSEYLLTGGPDTCGPTPNANGACTAATPAELQGFTMSIVQAINAMVDATLANQATVANGSGFPAVEQGYWCYNNDGCTDSSTTQYAALGLSAAQAVYNSPTFGDPGNRLPKILTSLAAASHVYAVDAAQGSQDTGCDPSFNTTFDGIGAINGAVGDSAAYGHGYHSPAEGYAPSMQQTASGMFVQLLGGSNVNSPMVQGYMRWIYDHYRWSDVGNANGAGSLNDGWPASYFYYMWSSFKGIEFIVNQGIPSNPGNLTTTSYGTLVSTAAPACTDRQVHRDPSALVRIPSMGAGGAGFYSAETQTQYFDYAYSILSYQCANGSFLCNGTAATGNFTNPDAGGGWATWDTQAYGLLVLQRATGVILPTATLVTSSPTATVGQQVTLTWGSTNANSCAASTGTPGDGWTGTGLATGGSLQVTETAPGPYTYTITCSAGTQTAQATVTVTFSKAVGPAMCDVSGPAGSSDGEVSTYDITALSKMLNQKVVPNGPAPANADPLGLGVVTAQNIRKCTLLCTKANCAN